MRHVLPVLGPEAIGVYGGEDEGRNNDAGVTNQFTVNVGFTGIDGVLDGELAPGICVAHGVSAQFIPTRALLLFSTAKVYHSSPPRQATFRINAPEVAAAWSFTAARSRLNALSAGP